MGLDPRLRTFINGPECVAGRPLFGFDNTPKNILVTITGLNECGFDPLPPPPASLILTQRAAPFLCDWRGTDGFWFWRLIAGLNMAVGIETGPDPLGQAFLGVGPPESIKDLQLCTPDIPFIKFVGGTAIASWGPGI